MHKGSIGENRFRGVDVLSKIKPHVGRTCNHNNKESYSTVPSTVYQQKAMGITSLVHEVDDHFLVSMAESLHSRSSPIKQICKDRSKHPQGLHVRFLKGELFGPLRFSARTRRRSKREDICEYTR